MSKVGDLKTMVEHATAENFIQWYNTNTGRNWIFSRKQEAPDFIYTEDNEELGLEVTTIYYNQDHARVTWEMGRGRRRVPTIQEIIDNPEDAKPQTIREPENNLIDFANSIIRNKCTKSYSMNCILVIRAPMPALTTDHEFQHEVVPNIRVPAKNPFQEIYLTANQQRYFKFT